MTQLVDALDRAWSYYAQTTGRLPGVDHSLNGRDEIAEVTSTCGAGCTYLGATGTEILHSYFENMYQEIATSDQFDQIPFYELGRSFWFWGPQLEFQSPDQDPVATGFAVLMRFTSMAAAGVAGAPFNGTPFPTFASQVRGLAGEYEADTSLTFAGTLAQDKSPGQYGGTDFWASLMMQLAARHGGQEFLTRFFHHASSLSAATSTAAAVTNWLKDADYAACTNLSSVFYARWGFPHPDGSVDARSAAAAVPEPPGSCPKLSVGRAMPQPHGVTVPVTCNVASGGHCEIALELTAGRRRVVIGAARHLVALGEAVVVAVRLNRLGRRLSRRADRLRAVLIVSEVVDGRAHVMARQRLRLA